MSIRLAELPKKKQVGLLYKRIVYSIGIPNDLHILVLIRHFTIMGVQELHKRAFDKYGHGRLTGTGTGVLYEWQRVFVGNLIMTRTVYQSPTVRGIKKLSSTGADTDTDTGTDTGAIDNT